MKNVDKNYVEYLRMLVKSGGSRGASAQTELLKYSDDEERDDHGRFAGGSGGSSEARAAVQRASAAGTDHVAAAYAHGMAAKMHEELAKAAPTPEARAMHEDAATAHLQAASAHQDAEYARANGASDAKEYSNDAEDLTAEAERASSYAFDGAPQKSLTPTVAKYSDDQARDDNGRFASGSGSGSNGTSAEHEAARSETTSALNDYIRGAAGGKDDANRPNTAGSVQGYKDAQDHIASGGSREDLQAKVEDAKAAAAAAHENYSNSFSTSKPDGSDAAFHASLFADAYARGLDGGANAWDTQSRITAANSKSA